MIRLAILTLFMAMMVPIAAQTGDEHNLAIQYYRNGEYDKAAELFEKLYKKQGNTDYYYRYYYNCLIQLQDFKTLERVVKKEIKDNPTDPTYKVDMGYVISQQGNVTSAYAMYEEAIKSLGASRAEVVRLANAFNNVREYDFAVKAYEQGRKLVKDYAFSYEIAGQYRAIGNASKMLQHYLDHLVVQPQQTQNIQSLIISNIEDDEVYTEFQRILFDRIQKSPETILYNEMLIWLYLQRKDYSSAFIQSRALDKRLNEQGERIFSLSQSALAEKQYDAALKALQYLQEKGQGSPYFYYAREQQLKVKKIRITEDFNYTQENLVDLKEDYLAFLGEYGANRLKSADTRKELAHLEGYYLHNLEAAIEIMEELLATPGLPMQFLNGAKLDLGDYYLMSGDIWEATLLYSQVDKAMRDEPMGEMARFKNAKLSYYRGDFVWAQTQLNILKGATSDLISNDAIELSVFLTTHIGLDTTERPMEKFARADLLSFQNRDNEAIKVLDSIMQVFPGHDLTDDIFFLKARIALKRQNIPEAVRYLKLVEEQQSDRILMDDALFLLGTLHEENLGDLEAAMAYYERLLLEFKDSIFTVEARNRYRALRGDKLN